MLLPLCGFWGSSFDIAKSYVPFRRSQAAKATSANNTEGDISNCLAEDIPQYFCSFLGRPLIILIILTIPRIIRSVTFF